MRPANARRANGQRPNRADYGWPRPSADVPAARARLLPVPQTTATRLLNMGIEANVDAGGEARFTTRAGPKRTSEVPDPDRQRRLSERSPAPHAR